MKITTLIENRPSELDPNLAFEWGLSLHVAHEGRSILLDTGTSGAFADNAGRLSVNVEGVEAVVLSHHHFDHGGGLRRFFSGNGRAKVYLAGEPDGDCYASVMGFFNRYIGLDRSLLPEYPDRFSHVAEPVELFPDIFIFPRICRHHPRPAGNSRLYLKRNGLFAPDSFEHELVLAIRDAGRLVVFTGCSHSGIMNMIDTVADHFPGTPIKAVIGGLHLTAMPPFGVMADRHDDVLMIGRALLDYPVDMTYTGHCTCDKAYSVLKSVMGGRLAEIRTGSVIEV